MCLKHGDKVQKTHYYHKLVWEDTNDVFGFRKYYYEEKWSVAFYDPVFRYRYDPVPNIHRYKKCPRGYYRHPKTTQELRLVEPHSEFVRIRSKRTKNYLPVWYDDLTIADNKQRGWKRTKKKRQWI